MTNLAGSRRDELDGRSVGRGADNRARFIPGQPDMWAFVFFETLVFTAYFVVYLLFRTGRPEAFLQSQADLDLRIGIFNTIALLTSSWCVALCVQASREGRFRAALVNAFLTAFFGVVFFASKVFEWVKELQLGNGPTTSEFFQHYYFLTAIHCLHLVIGFVVLGVVIYQLWSPNRRSQNLVETGATYWHTVDFLWVLIFALLYVVR
jgi:nitric oxide reductase NorE protein